MPVTPRYSIRLPGYLKKAIEEKVGKMKVARYIIQAVEEKLKRDRA